VFLAVPAGADVSWADQLARFGSGALRTHDAQLATRRAELAQLPPAPGDESSDRIGWHSGYGPPSGLAIRHVQVDLGAVEEFDAVVLVPVNVVYGSHPGPGYGFPVRFRVEAADEPEFAMPAVLADFTAADFPNPGQLPVFVESRDARARFVRVTATQLFSRADSSLFALGELLVFHGQRNLAALAPVTSSAGYTNSPAWEDNNATDGQSVLGAPVRARHPPGNGYHSAIAERDDEAKWVQIDFGREVPIDEVRLFAAAPIDFPARSGFGFPVRFRVEAGADSALSEPVVLGDFTSADFTNPGASPVCVPAQGVAARYVRVTGTRLWRRYQDYVFALAEMQVHSGGMNVAAHAAVEALDSTEIATWSTGFLNDGFTSQGALVDWAEWLRGLSRRRELLVEIAEMERTRVPMAAAGLRALGSWAVTGLLAIAAGVGAWLWSLRRSRQRELRRLRQRIAGDLHDEIGSNLGSITLLSGLARDRNGAGNHTDLAEIHRIAQETADSMRDIVWLMKPGPRSAADLMTRMREIAAGLLAGTEWTFEAEGVTGPFTLEFERQSLLLFKEALNNVRKHAEARHVTIVVRQTGREFALLISDDGAGFDPAVPGSGLGLESMRQRAAAVGGALAITSEPSRGTRLEVHARL